MKQFYRPFASLAVSAEKTYQVQYIVEGELEIDTTKGIWTHIPNVTDPTFVFSYYGKIEQNELKDPSTKLSMKYDIALFKWQVPIFFNDSTVVKVIGKNSLHLRSKEGMFLGSNFKIGHPAICEEKLVGGFCKCDYNESKGK